MKSRDDIAWCEQQLKDMIRSNKERQREIRAHIDELWTDQMEALKRRLDQEDEDLERLFDALDNLRAERK